MRLIIEALGINQPGGVRTGILNTIIALPQVAPDIQFIVYLSSFEPGLANFPQIQQRIIRTSNRFLARLNLMVVLPYVTRHERVDLVHFTKNLATWFNACPNIITVHDLTTLLYPGTQSEIDVAYWRWIEPLSLKNANKVITVSADTGRDLTKLYGIPRENIRIIRWAPDDRFRYPVEHTAIERVRKVHQLPEEYVLFLGILAKKKNLRTLILTMELLRNQGRDYHLVIAGRRYLQSNASYELGLIETLGLQSVIHTIGPVADEDLPALYAAASAYVLPSLHEGFGIPCWEAMAIGLPVIASRRGALPEVIGDAGVLVDDPLDVRAWADAINRVIQDKSLRAKLIEQGHCRIGDRTWKTVASETIDVYQEVSKSQQIRVKKNRSTLYHADQTIQGKPQ
jgi:glycosyltransferase involved in cell wall biosynthesis